MNTIPKVSVIVPVYNVEKYLHRCIDSILAQTFTDFELLLIDDGSKDKSGVICDGYAEKDNRVRIFHKENGGVSSARNLGLDNARGKWITFVDADDWVYQNWLSNFSPGNDAYDLKCQSLRTDKPIASEKRFESQREYGFNYDGDTWTLMELLFKNYVLGYLFLKIFRSSIIRKYQIRFDTEIKFREDELFVLQYAQYADSGSCTSKIGYFYYVPNWDNKYKMRFTEIEYVYKKQLLCLPEYRGLTFIKTELYRVLYSNLQSLYLLEFENKHNRNYCLKKLRILLSRDFSTSCFSLLTKIILRYDFTGLLSSQYLRLLNLKNNLSRKLNRYREEYYL